MTKYFMCQDNYVGFTKGKVYSTNVHGKLVDDDGDTRSNIHPHLRFWARLFKPLEIVEANE